MKKNTAVIVLSMAAAVILAGCGKEAVQQQRIPETQEMPEQEGPDLEKQKRIVDDYAARLLQEDADSLAYDKVLDVLHDYGEAPDEERLQAARAELAELREAFEAAYQNMEPAQLEPELVQMLTEQRILTAEYEAFARDRSLLLSGFLDDLDCLELYLEYSVIDEDGMEQFRTALDRYQKIQQEQKQYYYTSINLWFAGWGQEAVTYIKEQVMDNCRSFYSHEFEWKDSADEVEKQMMVCLDHMEAVNGDLVAELGRMEEELSGMQKGLDALK